MAQLNTGVSIGEGSDALKNFDIRAYNSYLEGLVLAGEPINIEERLMGFQFKLPDGSFAYPTAIKIKGDTFFKNLLPEEDMGGSIPTDDSTNTPRSHYFFERYHLFNNVLPDEFPQIEAIAAYKRLPSQTILQGIQDRSTYVAHAIDVP